MFIYGVLAPALAAVASISFVAPALGGAPNLASGDRERYLRDPAIKAFLYGVPVYLLLLAYRHLIPLDRTYRLINLYLDALVSDTFGFAVLIAVGSVLFNRHLRDGAPGELFTAHSAFFAVAYTVLAVAEAAAHPGVWTIWELTTQPVLWISTVVVFPLSLTVADTVHGGGWAALLLIIQPLVAAAVPMLSAWLLPGAAIAAAVGVVALTGGALWGFAFRAGA